MQSHPFPSAMHIAEALKARGFFVIFALLGLFVSLIAYAVLINASAGVELRLNKLSANLTKLEGERAKHQATLAAGSLDTAVETPGLIAEGLSRVGSDFSYLHANEVFVDASHLRP